MKYEASTNLPEAVFSSMLLDANGQPEILIDSSDPASLFWTLNNNSSDQSLVITPFGSGSVGPKQYHFMFTFVPGTFSEAPIIPGWDVAVDDAGGSAVKTLYLALSGTNKLTIAPLQAQRSTITYTNARQVDPASASIGVTLTAGQNVALGGISTEGHGYGPTSLDLVTTSMIRSTPLSVDFVGRRSVLNDGATDNSFTFAVTNMTATKLVLTPATVFSVWFDAAPNEQLEPGSYAWALAKVQDLDSPSVSLQVPDAWQWKKDVLGSAIVLGNPQWQLTVTAEVVLDPQAPVLFTFSGLKSDLAPGFTRMYLSYQNVPGYFSGTLVAELEKTPLGYGTEQGQGLYLSAGVPQGGTPPPAPDYDTAGLTVRQFGNQPGAQLLGGMGLVAVPDPGQPAASLQGPTQVQVGTQNLDGLTVGANNNAAALAVTQSGQGLAAKLTGDASISGALTAGNTTINGTLSVTGGATVTGAAVLESLAVNGDSQLGGTAQATNISASGTLTAGATTLSGLLTANQGASLSGQLNVQGPVAMFGAYQPRDFNQPYTAETDGFVVALANRAQSPKGFCVYSLDGFVNGLYVAMATGGNFGAFEIISDSQFNPLSVQHAESMMYPVPKGAGWYVNFNWATPTQRQVDATPQLYWLPVGASATAAIAPPIIPASPPSQDVARRAEPDLDATVSGLVGELGEAFGKPLSTAAKQALEERVHKLVKLEPTPRQIESYVPAMENLTAVLERILERPIPDEQKQEFVDALKRLL